jgi:anti-sigma B factor antagonist
MPPGLHHDSRAAVLRLHGDVDFFSEDAFRAEAEQLLAAEIDEFIVDLGDVNMIDSSGLSLLVDLLRLCREMGLPMLLRDVPEQVRQLLDITGLSEVMAADESELKERHSR